MPASPVPPRTVQLSPVLLSDDRIARIPAIECGEPLVDLVDYAISTPDQQVVREGLADRLAIADSFLPTGIRLHVVEGLRELKLQQEIYDGYRDELLRLNPGISAEEAHVLASRSTRHPSRATALASSTPPTSAARPARTGRSWPTS